MATNEDYQATRRYLDDRVPTPIAARGNLDILRGNSLALFCSVKCPGTLILRTYDFARALRDAGVTVIGGFHTPMERECLALLLRGTQPLVVCPARSIDGMRLPAEWKAPLAEGRLLLLSPFPDRERRVTAHLSEKRNAFVAALATRVFVAHAAARGKTERFCSDIVASGKPLLTLDDPANANLIAIGARPLRAEDLLAELVEFPTPSRRTLEVDAHRAG